MVFKLHVYPNARSTAKIQLAASYSGAEVATVEGFNFPADCTKLSFKDKNPIQKVPVLETEAGEFLFESDAIAKFVAGQGEATTILPTDALAAAQVDQWMQFISNEVYGAAAPWVYTSLGYIAYNFQLNKLAKERAARGVEALNYALRKKTYLVGERFTLADISAGVTLQFLVGTVFDEEFMAPFGNVKRYLRHIATTDNFTKIVGELVFIKEALKSETEKKKDAKKNKPKAAAPKKAAKKEVKKEEEIDTAAAAERVAKAKAAMRSTKIEKTAFDLNAFKRLYANTDETLKVVVPGFKEMCKDLTGWSVYKCKYDTPEGYPIKAPFYGSNLIGGWFQRSDRVRKHGFSSVLVVTDKETKEVMLEGMWIFRGDEVAVEMQDVIDYESWTWTKLDMTKEEDFQVAADYLCWEGKTLDGRVVVEDGKNFL